MRVQGVALFVRLVDFDDDAERKIGENIVFETIKHSIPVFGHLWVLADDSTLFLSRGMRLAAIETIRFLRTYFRGQLLPSSSEKAVEFPMRENFNSPNSLKGLWVRVSGVLEIDQKSRGTDVVVQKENIKSVTDDTGLSVVDLASWDFQIIANRIEIGIVPDYCYSEGVGGLEK